jgi:hypothetical protein
MAVAHEERKARQEGPGCTAYTRQEVKTLMYLRNDSKLRKQIGQEETPDTNCH